MARLLAPLLMMAAGGCDCGYRAVESDGGGDARDVALDAEVSSEDAGQGDGMWILEHATMGVYEPECTFAEGQRVVVRGSVEVQDACQQAGPVEVERGEPDHVLVLKARVWLPLDTTSCRGERTVYEDRWIDLGVLERGTWILSVPQRLEPPVTIEVGAPSEDSCSDQPCESDCLQGRCADELPENFDRCLPTDGMCASDGDCAPAQRCQGESCVFREAEPFVPCTSGADCISGWSCVVNVFDQEHGVCAVRCFTERTSCPFGECLASPGFGPAWTCSLAAD